MYVPEIYNGYTIAAQKMRKYIAAIKMWRLFLWLSQIDDVSGYRRPLEGSVE